MNVQLEALITANEYLDTLNIGIQNAVKYFQEEDEEEACTLIPQIADGIDWLNKVISLTEGVHKGKVSLEDINGKLSDIVEALQNEDYILVGDLFAYEVLPILEKAKQEIVAIVQN